MSAPMQTKPRSAGGDDFSLKAILPPLMAIIVAMIMVILDSTVVNNAIPKLVDYFDTDLKTIQWTVTGYTLALSAVIPLAGWMTDKFGSKQIFMITIALFTIGSVLCGIAQTPEQLIIFRIIQGLGGGMVGPIGMTMVFKLAPPERRGSVMGLLGIPMLMAPAFGPVLSGWLVDTVSWHWIFIINLPIGIIAFILGYKYLPKADRHAAPHLDVIGMCLAPIAFSMLAFGVSEGGTSWSSASTITGLTVGGIALILFIFVELRQKQPLLELKVFKSSDFTRSIILTWIVQLALFGAMLIVPLYLQGVMHYTALETGWILMPYALCAGIGMPISGRLFDKIGARPLAFAGLSVVSIALFILSGISVDTPLWVIILCICIMGIGMGFSMMPLNTHVLNAAPRRLVSRVTPLTTAAQQVVVSFAVAGLTGYLTSQIASQAAIAGADANPLTAVVAGYGDTFFLSACLVSAGVALSLLLRKPKMQEEEGTAGGDNPVPAMMEH
ncbi:DHA2 family efflux MFS transporter permease subunit [Paenibacillus sp. LHD-117]|uniref:DHA2 family efflux MFS transporter permease subunit n=1 Tax=Paenibacillus sp. LHD-117 TaxID=3071412 RepID=UPI0027E1C23C|nr:DHA2 family efflux MFS transporter permease subunit [Paenibacillus sp. LHD-117]MDQ6419672.1 DHA2 family efflux MFS transporter permease subunit [Paenibacillus sp. LHD-117]